MRSASVAILLLLCSAVAAELVPAAAWKHSGAAPNQTLVPLRLLLDHGSDGRDTLVAALRRVSDPSSSSYGDYMSADDVATITSAATAEGRRVVEAFLVAESIGEAAAWSRYASVSRR